MSPDDWGTLAVSIITAVGTVLGVWAMAGKTRAETARIRAEIETMRADQVTNHGSTSMGNAIDRLYELSTDLKGDMSALADDVSRVSRSIGGVRDDMRGLRAETSDRVNELADRQTAHELSCPGRTHLAHAIHHPPNPTDV